MDTGRRNADGIAGNVDTVQDDSRERRTVHVAVAGVPGKKIVQPTLNVVIGANNNSEFDR